ncbi:hypothetical protein EDD17DRAFT_1623172, partial [Pisolithus thermaeus]
MSFSRAAYMTLVRWLLWGGYANVSRTRVNLIRRQQRTFSCRQEAGEGSRRVTAKESRARDVSAYIGIRGA